MDSLRDLATDHNICFDGELKILSKNDKIGSYLEGCSLIGFPGRLRYTEVLMRSAFDQ